MRRGRRGEEEVVEEKEEEEEQEASSSPSGVSARQNKLMRDNRGFCDTKGISVRQKVVVVIVETKMGPATQTKFLRYKSDFCETNVASARQKGVSQRHKRFL